MVAISSTPLRPQVEALHAFRRSNPWIACSVNVNSPATSEPRVNRMFVFGLGYVGRYVSEQLKREGWHVSGTCRGAIEKKDLKELGLDAYIFETNRISVKTLSILRDATHIIISIPPVSGVYGDCGGGWVDEDSYVNPKTELAKLRLEAEKGWMHLGLELGFPANVFRLGGIYGPGRSALDTIMKNTYLSEKQKARESKLYTLRVHVADIYQSIKASFNVPSSGRIYNVVDDDPAPRAEVFAFARGLIKKKWPGLITDPGEDALVVSVKDRSPGEKLVSNARIKNELGVKLVSNARIKNELGVKLVYPSYRSGLENILASYNQ